LESTENLKPLIKNRFGREPNSATAREIIACLQQGRLFYEAAERAPLEIAPLQLFYGMVGFSKALILASTLRPLSTLKPSHGVSDVSAVMSRIADLRVKIGGVGTFQEFNDVAAKLTRVCYTNYPTQGRYSVSIPSTESTRLSGISLSLQEILGRIPLLDALYKLTFSEYARTASMSIETSSKSPKCIQIRLEDDATFTNLASLREIVGRLRDMFPFLREWRVNSAQYAWGDTSVWSENLPANASDEFSEENATCMDGQFKRLSRPQEEVERFALKEGLDCAAGYLFGGSHLISPVHGVNMSEFSLQYLALFLLGSLVRYRPQIWAHALSRSVFADKPLDDRMLSLIEKFLDLNRTAIPQLVVGILNPSEDFYSRYTDVQA
jgi:hypothetical protein